MPIVAVFETHVQADHVSGLPELVARTGATAYLPEGAGVEFPHHALADGEVVALGNTEVQALATPGHALAHHAYVVTDRTRGDEPWFVLTGDALLVGDAGRPDLHAHGEHTRRGDGAHALPLADRAADDAARPPRALPRALLGLGLRPRPVGQPDLHDRLRAPPQPRARASTTRTRSSPRCVEDIPPAPERQADIVAANRAGRPLSPSR